MNLTKRIKLLDKNNIYASVLTEWDQSTNRNCKFTPAQTVKVTRNTRKSEQGRYKKYVGLTGTVVAVSTQDGVHIRGNSNRQFTRYFVAFPEMGNKVVGLHSHYLSTAH